MKKAYFITTKNITYLRNVQEIDVLKKQGYCVDLLYSNGKNYLIRILEIYSKLFFKNVMEYEFIFVGFAPQLILPLFFWKFRKKKIYIDFFISIYDTLVNDRKKVRKESFCSRLLHDLDRITLEIADEVLADTKTHKNYFVKEFGVSEEKFHVLYLQADTSIYRPMQIEKPVEWMNQFLVLYFGSILPLQGVDVIMDAVGKLSNEKRIHFFIIGPLNPALRKVKGDTVSYCSWLSQKELAEKIAMADLCLAGHFSASIEKAGRTIPGKAYIYKAMNKKVIFGDSPANRELFEENGYSNYYVPMGDSDALAKCILELFEISKKDQESKEVTNGFTNIDQCDCACL